MIFFKLASGLDLYLSPLREERGGKTLKTSTRLLCTGSEKKVPDDFFRAVCFFAEDQQLGFFIVKQQPVLKKSQR